MSDTAPISRINITQNGNNQYTLRSTNTTSGVMSTLMSAMNATPGTYDVAPEGRAGRIRFKLDTPMPQSDLDELAEEWAAWIN